MCVRLGIWQLSRLSDRQDSNALIEASLVQEPVDVTALTAVGGGVSAEDEWRPVTLTGRYDTAEQLLVRYQTSEQQRGVDVVVPLVLADGTAVLVDRGLPRVTVRHPGCRATSPRRRRVR